MTRDERDGSAFSVLVVAKAPEPGLAKTRLAAAVGADAAADLAAAALLDTLDACEDVAGPASRVIALTGSVTAAARGPDIADRLQRWVVVDQRGATFAERLVHAHHDAAATIDADGELMVQVGMDTPQLTAADLHRLAVAVTGPPGADMALGPAEDGGWWGLATRAARYVDPLAGVPMSQDDTYALTRAALESGGDRVAHVHMLADVDTVDDARRVAATAPWSRFASTFANVCSEAAR